MISITASAVRRGAVSEGLSIAAHALVMPRRRPPSAHGCVFAATLSSEPKCNTPADLIIGTVDQDLRECCHCYSHLSDDEREQIGLAKAGGLFDRRDCQSDRPAEVDGLARALPQQAAERTLLAASRSRSLSIAQAA